MRRRQIAFALLVSFLSVAMVPPANARQLRVDSPAAESATTNWDAWSFHNAWNWLRAIFAEDHGQVVP